MRTLAPIACALLGYALLGLEAGGRYAPLHPERTAAVLFPFVALAGLPLCAPGAACARGPELAALLALPLGALAWALDRSGGAPAAGTTALELLAAVLALGAAGARGGRWYAWLWALSLPFPALLQAAYALSASGAFSAPPAALAGLFSKAPLVALARQVAGGAPAGAAVLFASLGLLAVALAERRCADGAHEVAA